MKFTRLLEIVGDELVFETGLLLAGPVKPAAGRLHQVRRGLYALAPPYRKVVPEPFLVANRLARGGAGAPASASLGEGG